jgi:acyl carrier protein
MSSAPWPASFDTILRSYLTLADGEQITAELNPVDRGLDSLATVGLLFDLEQRYAITIPDEQLTALASANVGELWVILEKAGAAREDETV